MLTRLRTLASLYRELGPRWLAFRVAYALRLRTGLIRMQFPQYNWDDRPLETWLKKDIPSNPESYSQWRKNNSPKFFFDSHSRAERSDERSSRHADEAQPAIEEANRLLNGEIKYFSHQYHHTGFPPNWHVDYVTLSGASRHEESLPPSSETLRSQQPLPQSDTTKHWSQISDDSSTDIKFLWEPNRFGFVYALVRAYSATQDEKYVEAFWQLLEDWAEKNPPNTGVNWMDGQEAALRLMAWVFGYYQFSDSPSSTPNRTAKFISLIAAHAERTFGNTSFAIFTHGNHSVTEALGLWMTGLLFPELESAEKYLAFGKMSLEREARAQIFPDGTYSMYSLNYHRFVLHCYLYAIQLGELNNFQFSNSLRSSISASLDYLSQLINPQTGEMPVYGSNDGALVLPLNNCDFTDYRPLLQLGWYITKGERLFEAGEWDEDLFWLCGESALTPSPSSIGRGERQPPSPLGRRVGGEGKFPNGGIYLLRNTNSHAILRCTDFTSRPSHADQLHMDLWMHGHNIAIDAGTYLYSGQGIWRNGLARTSVHNTVSVDNKDQMQMISRFTWTNWSKGKVLKHDRNLWQGEHDGYKPVSHKRTVMMLDDDRWLVMDNLTANKPHHYALHWLLADAPFEQEENSVLLSFNEMKYKIQTGSLAGNGNFSLVRADPESTRGWRSRYYARKEPAISLQLEANQKNVTFWTFFGFENDVVEVAGNEFRLNAIKITVVE
jgi:asparagine synthase (glutamine-hydrolysing)